MSRSRQLTVSALFISLGWMLASACSSSTDNSPPVPFGGGSGGNGGVGGSAGMGGNVIVQSGSSNGGSPDNINPLCGQSVTAGTCVPDQADACKDYKPPSLPGASGASAGGEAASGGAGGDSGMSGGGAPAGGAPNGTAGAPSGGAGGAQGGENHGGEGTLGASGAAGANNPPVLAQYSCQVAFESNQPIRKCVLAGTGGANAPCFSAADCAPSLACVSEGDAGRCRPYCCKPGTACTSSSYCAKRPLLRDASDTSNAKPQAVPVCVPADNCSLEDAFPCPADGQCRCQGDTACMVVRDDGTTTCLKPGTGQVGQSCDVSDSTCAWNHVCSSVTHRCVKICNTDPTKSECGAQKCQASSELPPNFGICVGPLK